MAVRKRDKELIPERKHPGDPEPDWCSPGSIEQELDMCEDGPLRGDEILHSHGKDTPIYTGFPREVDKIIAEENYKVDLAEEDREGDEMTGDEHSSGLSGGESEIESQPNISSGMPGDRTRREEEEARSQEEDVYSEEAKIARIPPRATGRRKPR